MADYMLSVYRKKKNNKKIYEEQKTKKKSTEKRFFFFFFLVSAWTELYIFLVASLPYMWSD